MLSQDNITWTVNRAQVTQFCSCTKYPTCKDVFRIRDTMVPIQMPHCGSVPLTKGFGCVCGSVPKSSVTFRMQKKNFSHIFKC